MKRKFNFKLFQSLCIALILFTVYSCSDDNTVITPSGPDAKSISGTITFADTNFVTAGGYYDLSAFPRAGWPPMAGPTQNDSLVITKVGNTYQAKYKLSNLPDGEYVLTTAWIKLPYNPSVLPNGLGIYGCDTSHLASCIFGTPGTVTISYSLGVEDINFLSWADTLNSIY